MSLRTGLAQLNRLGGGGPELSPLGFGSWATGGPSKFGWPATDDEESIKAIRFAVESGVNWVDTAAFYGRGHSEEVVGRALEPWKQRGEVLIFTKCGLRWFGEDRDGAPQNNLRPQSIRYECEQSLKRLGVERIDLYQFHWPDELGTPVEDSWATMLDLIKEGKVRWGGVSNFGVDLLDRCEKLGHVQSVQPKLNLLDRTVLADVVPWCRSHEAGVLAYSPLASGLLTGAWDEERVETLPADDWRKYSDDFRPPRVYRSLKLVAQLRQVAEGAGITLPVLATAWVLDQPGITGAIVGARNVDQVRGWLPAAGFSLTAEMRKVIDDLLRRWDAEPYGSMADIDLNELD
ncbi:MAG TPA: aldo/keto reductase [Actinomycetota bacterium]|nr:aldo/keto reductase [Actinomycetota bacterium]